MGSPQVTASGKSAAGFEPGKVFSAPLGVASPLWLAFMGAASAGVAFWWLTRWVKPFNLEAAHADPKSVEPKAIEPVIEAEPVLEAVSDEIAPAAEIVAETADEVLVEAAPAVEAVAEPAVKPAPAKAAPRKRPPAASAARISARTKRRQPEPAPKGPSKRR
jgi:hypothetical protein